MSSDLENQGNGAGEVTAEIGPGTIYACWNEYSVAVEASDKTPGTLKGLWDGYIATLRGTQRTISGCEKEYRDAVKALGSASESPDAKGGLWKTYMTLLKDFPMTPENLSDAGWTVPKRGDKLGLESYIFGAHASPDSLRNSNPDFVLPALTYEKIEILASARTDISPPELWTRTARISDVLRVKINGFVPFEVPIGLAKTATALKETTSILQLAVYKALMIALDHVTVLEQRHEPGTAEPGPYRLAFSLADVEQEDNVAKYMRDRGTPRAETGE